MRRGTPSFRPLLTHSGRWRASERVGAAGRVIRIERDEQAVNLAREFAEQCGLHNVEILHTDARSTALRRGSFDLATARLVLVNVPDPRQVISEAVAPAQPGGWVAFHEADWALPSRPLSTVLGSGCRERLV